MSRDQLHDTYYPPVYDHEIVKQAAAVTVVYVVASCITNVIIPILLWKFGNGILWRRSGRCKISPFPD